MTTDTIVRVDPSTLLVGPNVRREVTLPREFLASIKELGVRTPITAVETPDGLQVVDGQRRTLASVDVGLTEVPVFVTAVQTEAERIVDQVVVNEQRVELTQADAVAAVQQLALFDMNVPAIAKKVGLPAKFVKSAVDVGRSAATVKAMQESKISFDVACIIAEFDDFPGEQEVLLKSVTDGRHWDVAQKARAFQDAREETATAKAIKGLGVTLISDPGYSGDDPKPVSRLYLDKDKSEAASDAPHEQIVTMAGDGLCGFPSFEYVNNERKCVIAYAVQGWADRGFFGYSSGYASTVADPEVVKAERRVAREKTKEWVTATALRREFITQLVQRKSMPKGWESVVMTRLIDSGSHASTEWRAAIAFLGLKETPDSYSLRGVVEEYLKKTPAKALKVGLAVSLATIEGGFEFDRKGWSQRHTAAYLRQLEAWGYQLTNSEGGVLGRKARERVASS